MTLIAIAATVLIALAIRRGTPWLSFRPSRARALPRWAVVGLDAALPIMAADRRRGRLAAAVAAPDAGGGAELQRRAQATAAGFKGFTLKWYRQLFSTGLYLDSFMTSLQLALATSLVTVCLATPAAFALVRYRFFGQTALAGFWTLPIALPQIAIGIGMLRLLQTFIQLPAFLGLLLVHVTITLPFCIGCCAPRSNSSTPRRRRRRPAWGPIRCDGSCSRCCPRSRPVWRRQGSWRCC